MPLGVQALSDVRLLAFARASTGAVWSIFPTTNRVDGTWVDSYRWSPICSVTVPNAGQPRGVSVLTGLSSPQSSNTPFPPNAALQYVIALDNRERGVVVGTQLTLTASAGLTYQSALGPAGFTCTSCTPGANQFRISLPTLAANAITLVTVTGQLAADVSAIPSVSTTLDAQSGVTGLRGATLTHLTDGVPPTVTVLAVDPLVVRPGPVTLNGVASDGDGIGLATVEVRPAGSPTWQVASGSTAWIATLTVPNAATFALELRATDRYNQSSPVQTLLYAVDTTVPTVTLSVPTTLSGTLVQLSGSTTDPASANALVQKVEIQIDDGVTTTAWLVANGPFSPTNGSQGWNFGWNLPDVDGAVYRIRARATDAAGNIGIGDWQTTIVDTRAPSVTVTTVISNIGSAVSSPVLSGTITDGGGVSLVRVRVFAPDGQTYVETASVTGAAWAWIPQAALTEGTYQLRVEGVDLAGNVREKGPYLVTVSAQSVTPTPTSTATTTPTATETPVNTVTPTVTPTQVGATATATETPINTATPIVTATPVGATATATETPVNTVTPTMTPTPGGPTATSTPTSPSSPTPTSTPTVNGTLIGTCSTYTVYRTVQGQYVAAGWTGNIIVGTDSNNVLNGTSGADLMLGLGGNDTLDGQGGNDVMCGGTGVDLLRGGADNDYLEGGAGSDVLNGGTGDFDQLYGGDGTDALLDGDGVLIAQGGVGADAITLSWRNGWRDQNNQARIVGVAAGYGNDVVALAILDPARFYVDITGDERDTPPSSLE